jgi:hypothetical protein
LVLAILWVVSDGRRAYNNLKTNYEEEDKRAAEAVVKLSKDLREQY